MGPTADIASPRDRRRACARTARRIPVALVAALAIASPAYASTNQGSLFQVPDRQLFARIPQTLQTLRDMGVRIIKVTVAWKSIAPWATLTLRPPLFDATNPADYPAVSWLPYDTIVADASRYDMQVEFTVDGGAPLWAASSGAPWQWASVWDPSPTDYAQFMQAVGRRYPAVHMWELWNEPNWGTSLAPQVDAQSDIVSAEEYRSLVSAGWQGLRASGHGGDTIVAGGMSPDPSSPLTPTGTTSPLGFIRALYCANRSYHALRGGAAQAIGCPTTAAASARFRSENPALFGLSGFGVHPYSFSKPPIRSVWGNPDAAEFVGIPRLSDELRSLQSLYGSHHQMEIFNTEYGYQTSPPNPPAFWFTTPAVASVYMNWAEYLSWRNPLIQTFAQYQLQDSGSFDSGLLFANGEPKPSFDAYLLPLFLPSRTTLAGRALEMWGGVRPAANARQDSGRVQSVQIQFRRRPRDGFRTVRTVPITDPAGYFDVRVKFPASGDVRLAWAYPPGDQRLRNPLDPGQLWVYSRIAQVTIRPRRS